MNFKQLIGQYALSNLMVEQLPDVAYKGLEEGFESPSLIILAGIEKTENSIVIEQYFKSALTELDINIPNWKSAAFEYVIIMVQEIIDGKKDVFYGVGEIISKVIEKYDFESENIKYVYDGIFFERIYGLYDQYNDLENSLVQISEDKSREELVLETRQELLAELIIWKSKLQTNGLI